MQCLQLTRGEPPATVYDIFANNSREAIIAACQRGNVPDTWAAGDSKMMTINGTSYQIDIIGKNTTPILPEARLR